MSKKVPIPTPESPPPAELSKESPRAIEVRRQWLNGFALLLLQPFLYAVIVDIAPEISNPVMFTIIAAVNLFGAHSLWRGWRRQRQLGGNMDAFHQLLTLERWLKKRDLLHHHKRLEGHELHHVAVQVKTGWIDIHFGRGRLEQLPLELAQRCGPMGPMETVELHTLSCEIREHLGDSKKKSRLWQGFLQRRLGAAPHATATTMSIEQASALDYFYEPASRTLFAEAHSPWQLEFDEGAGMLYYSWSSSTPPHPQSVVNSFERLEDWLAVQRQLPSRPELRWWSALQSNPRAPYSALQSLHYYAAQSPEWKRAYDHFISDHENPQAQLWLQALSGSIRTAHSSISRRDAAGFLMVLAVYGVIDHMAPWEAGLVLLRRFGLEQTELCEEALYEQRFHEAQRLLWAASHDLAPRAAEVMGGALSVVLPQRGGGISMVGAQSGRVSMASEAPSEGPDR